MSSLPGNWQENLAAMLQAPRPPQRAIPAPPAQLPGAGQSPLLESLFSSPGPGLGPPASSAPAGAQASVGDTQALEEIDAAENATQPDTTTPPPVASPLMPPSSDLGLGSRQRGMTPEEMQGVLAAQQHAAAAPMPGSFAQAQQPSSAEQVAAIRAGLAARAAANAQARRGAEEQRLRELHDMMMNARGSNPIGYGTEKPSGGYGTPELPQSPKDVAIVLDIGRKAKARQDASDKNFLDPTRMSKRFPAHGGLVVAVDEGPPRSRGSVGGIGADTADLPPDLRAAVEERNRRFGASKAAELAETGTSKTWHGNSQIGYAMASDEHGDARARGRAEEQARNARLEKRHAARAALAQSIEDHAAGRGPVESYMNPQTSPQLRRDMLDMQKTRVEQEALRARRDSEERAGAQKTAEFNAQLERDNKVLHKAAIERQLTSLDAELQSGVVPPERVEEIRRKREALYAEYAALYKQAG